MQIVQVVVADLSSMARTSVNVIGNCLATAAIARSEHKFDEATARNFKSE